MAPPPRRAASRSWRCHRWPGRRCGAPVGRRAARSALPSPNWRAHPGVGPRPRLRWRGRGAVGRYADGPTPGGRARHRDVPSEVDSTASRSPRRSARRRGRRRRPWPWRRGRGPRRRGTRSSRCRGRARRNASLARAAEATDGAGRGTRRSRGRSQVDEAAPTVGSTAPSVISATARAAATASASSGLTSTGRPWAWPQAGNLRSFLEAAAGPVDGAEFAAQDLLGQVDRLTAGRRDKGQGPKRRELAGRPPLCSAATARAGPSQLAPEVVTADVLVVVGAKVVVVVARRGGAVVEGAAGRR